MTENTDWLEETVANFPGMFATIHPLNYGCGEGWKDIINKLCTDLHALDPAVTVVQIKEKFGTLRFYLGCCGAEANYEAIYARITEAEKQSAITCEWCGAPGTLDTSKHWVITLCPDCSKKRQYHFVRGQE